MEVVIAGGHGQIALHLSRMLSDRGDRVRGIIRDRSQADDLGEVGSEPEVLDLEQASAEELSEVLRGADAVVFAAGAGSGSGAARKHTVDYAGAVKLLEAARDAGVERYVMISSMGADDPPMDDNEVFSVYLRAKARADQELMASDLAWTIVRPGPLNDETGTGRVTVGAEVERSEIPREDVAAVLVRVLDEQATAGVVFEVVGGDTPVDEAIRSLVT